MNPEEHKPENQQEEDNLQETPIKEQTNENQENTSPDFEALYNEMNDRYLRLYSEFDNYRKRTAREKSELIKSAGSDVLKSIVSVVDDFERAIKANESATEPEVMKDGFKLIHSKFSAFLLSKGVKQMELMGQVFNADLAEAIANVPGEESMRGKIIDVVENGYYLNDSVLRYAKVVVGQ